MKKILISTLLASISSYVSAQEIHFKNINFQFKDTWTVNESNHQLALKSPSGRYFIASVFTPSNAFESLNMSIKAEETLNALASNRTITIYKPFQDYSSPSGVPYRAIQFTSENPKGFVIGGIVNSNYAFLLFTYEGPGAIDEGAKEIQQLFSGMSIKKP